MLGAGAMGSVYLAHDEMLERPVAIKTIRTLGLRGVAAELFRERFKNEAKAVAALSHPNIVPLYDIGFEADTPFLVMELVDGPSLKDRLEAGRLGADEVRMLGVQLGRALAAAHGRGILHRDVKPANVLAAGAGTWKLADFGVAHVPDSSLTMTGQFVGSPAYSAPEAMAFGMFGPASDVYSLGATLYEAMSGRRPYSDEQAVASVTAIVGRPDPVPVGGLAPDMPGDVAAAVMRALARDPAARPTASELADMLAAGFGGAAVAAAGVGAAGVGAVGVGAVGIGAVGGAGVGAIAEGSVPGQPSARAMAAVALGAITTAPGAETASKHRKALVVWGGLAAAVIIGVIIGSRGSNSGTDRPASGQAAGSLPSPLATPTSFEPTTLTISSDPGVSLPPGQADKAAKEWHKILDKLQRGEIDEALDKLSRFEQRYGETEQTRSLRTQLAAMPRDFGSDRGQWVDED